MKNFLKNLIARFILDRVFLHEDELRKIAAYNELHRRDAK